MVDGDDDRNVNVCGVVNLFVNGAVVAVTWRGASVR
jgi:hypothetical protein